MHAAKRLLFRENYIRKSLSNGHSANVYTLEIDPLYGTLQCRCDSHERFSSHLFLLHLFHRFSDTDTIDVCVGGVYMSGSGI